MNLSPTVSSRQAFIKVYHLQIPLIRFTNDNEVENIELILYLPLNIY